MDLPALYTTALRKQELAPDAAQLRAVDALQRIGTELCRTPSPTGLTARLLRRFGPVRPVRGAYLWGGVGRGKTFIMDLFFEALPFDEKLRFHFHRLMYRVHQRMNELGDIESPIDTIAEEFAARARVLCFDEFFISDIGDAMILGKLIAALFRRRVTLVATSNIHPDDLYRDGLQRQQFLPAIDLIKQHAEIIEVDAGTDYRLRVLEQAEIYHSPLNATAEENLAAWFAAIAPETGTSGQPVEILGRNIPSHRRADGIIWFDFAALCEGPRSQDDYIEIAKSFQTVLLSGVPAMNDACNDQARRFIALVDELYDRRVNLILSAAAPIDDLYSGVRLGGEFQRTRSRLREMQTARYLGEGHRA